MVVLIDTSFLLALSFTRDANHQKARLAMQSLTGTRVISMPVLPEVFYMVADRVSYRNALMLYAQLRTQAFRIEALTDADMLRMNEIMVEYEDNAFDFVDAAIMAQAERLNIQTVYTLDRTDFTTFRPHHCSSLSLLPEL